MKSKVKSLVNMNVNPCKMCMPMGSATAFYGIKNCMTILHGSQGCATYIRRHMATHYNEPVDIASSSLTEEGTVYGGSKNLKKGLKNLIELYHPEVIGVMTTCLAETIGEDVAGIIDEFYEENSEYQNVAIIAASSPGYGGTQFEGYYAALYSIVSSVQMNTTKNEKINVITSPLSPADTRYLKNLFAGFGIDIILLPDLSKNLDGEHSNEYNRLPHNGTTIDEIRSMGGARMTIELCGVEVKNSVGEYLYDTYKVPYRKLNLPVGLRDTQALMECLSEISGMDIPEEYAEEKGRYLDAIIDSHKYNSVGRAAVYGEPDFVYSVSRMLLESGIMPVVCSTGAICSDLRDKLSEEIDELSKMYYENNYEIMDKADFKDIEEKIKKYSVNVMIGNSDGRRIATDMGIPLIRRGFPVHDHVGGQRLRMLGYEGSIMLLDEVTNALVDTTENSFRETLTDKYYKGTAIEKKADNVVEINSIAKKTETHPCFNCGAHKYARIHLPIAPACNVQCNYCVRKFDCANESRPGVTSNVLTPQEALDRYVKVKEKMPNLTVVGIAGPGDALANWESVSKTLKYIREYDEDVTFCLSTNGLFLPEYADEIDRLGVKHVTVTLNAVDPHISGQIYKYITYKGRKYEGDAAGAIMVANQLAGIRMMVAKGAVVKINIVTVKGVNDEHIPEVVKTVKDIGCYITNIMQMIPVKGSGFENYETLTNMQVQKIRKECEKIMPQMYHCGHCRADAIGTLDNDISIDLKGFLAKDEKAEVKDVKKSYRFAVASKSGMIVDTHFGHADEFYIYDYVNGDVRFAEKRKIDKYCTGAEECDNREDKMNNIIDTLEGCNGVIAMRIGMESVKKLDKRGIKSINTYDMIDEAVKKAALTM